MPSKPAALSGHPPGTLTAILFTSFSPLHRPVSKSVVPCLQTMLESARISPSSVAALAPTQPVCPGSRPSLRPIRPTFCLGVPTCFTASFSPTSSFLCFIL